MWCGEAGDRHKFLASHLCGAEQGTMGKRARAVREGVVAATRELRGRTVRSWERKCGVCDRAPTQVRGLTVVWALT